MVRFRRLWLCVGGRGVVFQRIFTRRQYYKDIVFLINRQVFLENLINMLTYKPNFTVNIVIPYLRGMPHGGAGGICPI